MALEEQETSLVDDADIHVKLFPEYDKSNRSQFSNYDVKHELAFEDDELLAGQRTENDKTDMTDEEMQVEESMLIAGMHASEAFRDFSFTYWKCPKYVNEAIAFVIYL